MTQKEKPLKEREGYIQANFFIPAELKDRLTDYYHANHRRIGSVSEALAELVDAGLRAKGADQ